MKYNKFIILSFLALISGVFFQGCKKFIDQQPITDLDPGKVFSDVPNTYKALAGAYSRLMGDNAYGIRVSLYFPLDNDEMQGPTGASDNDRRDIARYIATSGNAQIERPFNQMFQGIEFSNLVIANIPRMGMYNNGTENEKKQLRRMLGEALTLRAQFYFEAIRNWGDLPMHFAPGEELAGSNQYPSRTDRDSLYMKILADLDTAAVLVPWRNELSAIGDPVNERITRGSVKGLRARIALFMGGYSLRNGSAKMERRSDYAKYYTIARQEAQDIMQSNQHSLNPSFKGLWKDQVGARVAADPNGELMFQASAIGATSAADSKLGYYNGPRVNNRGNNSVNPLPTYLYLFDSLDNRRDVTIAPYFVAANGSTKIGQAITNMNDGKYRRDWITNPIVDPNSAVQYFSLKWQILRYSDVLLMFAEAENELNGPTPAAYDALNMVRRRGFGQPIGTTSEFDIPAGLSKADFFKAIVRERALELGGEGVRKYDLIRWNLIASSLDETKANLKNMSERKAIVSPTYMADYPSYSKVSTLPQYMYFITTSTADNSSIWANSLYKASPASTPTGTTRVNWVRQEIGTVALARFATGFTPNKSELLPIPQPARDANPNLSQNPGY